MTILASAVFGIDTGSGTGNSSETNKYPIAVWLVPARESQWRIWEANAALARTNDAQDHHIPVFQPHATFCTGDILYNTNTPEELTTNILKLQSGIQSNRALLTNTPDGRLMLKLLKPDDPVGIGNWWSQFVFLPFQLDGWPELGTNKAKAQRAFPEIDGLKLSWKKDGSGANHEDEVMPHVSMMYCRTDRLKDFNASAISAIKRELTKGPPWPSNMFFDAIQIATPEPLSTNWEDLVNNDPAAHPVQWRVIYTCPLGAKLPQPPDGTLTNVVSGGQTGPDTAAMRAGMECGLVTGGWCPPNESSEMGKIPAEYLLKKTRDERSADAQNSIPRSMRTQRNAQDSDATLIFWPSSLKLDADKTAGTLYTWWSAASFPKPVKFCDPNPTNLDEIHTVVEWLRTNKVGTLNVAGPLESSSHGVGEDSYKFLLQVFDQVKKPSLPH